MSDIRETFESRKQEILKFVEFVKFLEDKEFSLTDEGESEFSLFFHSAPNGISVNYQEIINIAKSNLALMIYSIIEYTVANSIDNIYEEIRNDGLSYLNISDNIKALWRASILKTTTDPNSSFSTFMKKNEEIINMIIHERPIDLCSRNTLPAGNLDGEKIKDTLQKHGVKWESSNYRPDILNKFKEKRNNLAHGSVSFIEALRDSTIANIEQEANLVIAFLEDLLNMVDKYISNKDYKQAKTVSLRRIRCKKLHKLIIKRDIDHSIKYN